MYTGGKCIPSFFPLALGPRTQELVVGTANWPHHSAQQILVLRALSCCAQLHLVSMEKTGELRYSSYGNLCSLPWEVHFVKQGAPGLTATLSDSSFGAETKNMLELDKKKRVEACAQCLEVLMDRASQRAFKPRAGQNVRATWKAQPYRPQVIPA